MTACNSFRTRNLGYDSLFTKKTKDNLLLDACKLSAYNQQMYAEIKCEFSEVKYINKKQGATFRKKLVSTFQWGWGGERIMKTEGE